MALVRFRAAPLSNPPPHYDQQYIRQVIRVLETYFSQIDSLTPNHAQSYSAKSFFGGGLSLSVALLDSTDSPYTVLVNDFSFMCDTTSAVVELLLPAASTVTGRILVAKRLSAGANVVTLTPDGSDTIDGAADLDLTTQWQAVTIQSDGVSNWYVV